MEHLVVRVVEGENNAAIAWAQKTLDGELLDLDVFNHESTFLLNALGSKSGRMGYLPVQQPFMLENLIFRPNLTDGERARTMTRMAEAAIGEAYRRDAGEIYFLCREPSTCAFAEHHEFKDLQKLDPKLKLYRLNLLETFGAR